MGGAGIPIPIGGGGGPPNIGGGGGAPGPPNIGGGGGIFPPAPKIFKHALKSSYVLSDDQLIEYLASEAAAAGEDLRPSSEAEEEVVAFL